MTSVRTFFDELDQDTRPFADASRELMEDLADRLRQGTPEGYSFDVHAEQWQRIDEDLEAARRSEDLDRFRAAIDAYQRQALAMFRNAHR